MQSKADKQTPVLPGTLCNHWGLGIFPCGHGRPHLYRGHQSCTGLDGTGRMLSPHPDSQTTRNEGQVPAQELCCPHSLQIWGFCRDKPYPAEEAGADGGDTAPAVTPCSFEEPESCPVPLQIIAKDACLKASK